MGSDTDRGQSAAEKALVGREQFFVQDVLSESEENLTRKYKLKRQGLGFEKVLDEVSSIFQLEKDYITAKGRQIEGMIYLII
jgi:hypothetical protein